MRSNLKLGALTVAAWLTLLGRSWADEPMIQLATHWVEQEAVPPGARPVLTAPTETRPTYGIAQPNTPGWSPPPTGFSPPQSALSTPPVGSYAPATTSYPTTFGSIASAFDSCCGGNESCTDPNMCDDRCPRWGLELFTNYDSWRGISEDIYQNNNGASYGFNAGVPIPLLSALGMGAQFGGSYGTYDYMGRPLAEQNRIQQQTFATAGLFRRADANLPISLAFAHDWMANDNFGSVSDEPFLAQWRAQVGYMINPRHEIGVWGSWLERFDTQQNDVTNSLLTYRPVSQLNLYWHCKSCWRGADFWTWVGLPDRRRGNGDGTLGEFIVGSAINVPINDRLAVMGNCVYMKPSANAGFTASAQDGFNLSLGIAWYPGRQARSCTVAGRTWMPLLPVANNGNFWVDRY